MSESISLLEVLTRQILGGHIEVGEARKIVIRHEHFKRERKLKKALLPLQP
jgi:hypothetical protein